MKENRCIYVPEFPSPPPFIMNKNLDTDWDAFKSSKTAVPASIFIILYICHFSFHSFIKNINDN